MSVAWSGVDPPLTPFVKKKVIGYYEGGSWSDYQGTLCGVINQLMELGWIKKKELPILSDEEDTSFLWNWLVENAESDFISFSKEHYWSADWSEDTRKILREEIIKRLNEGKIDMIWALGTWAGQDLSNNKHSVPTIVMSTTNPVEAGIIKSAKDSGYKHVHARIDPFRYRTQFKLFHDIVKFKNIGVIHANTNTGHIFGHVEDLETVAKKFGFNVVDCHACDVDDCDGDAEIQSPKEYLECLEEIAPKIDAFSLSDHYGTRPENMPNINKILFKYNIPSWSTRGAELVEYGATLSVFREDFNETGLFYAEIIGRVLNGEMPGDINQIHRETPTLMINIEAARRIGFKIPRNVMKIASKVYDEIKVVP
jgi:ABC-type uncharacterized transport system substrate-binding protein